VGQSLIFSDSNVVVPSQATESSFVKFWKAVYQETAFPFLDGISSTFFNKSRIFAAAIGLALFSFAQQHALASFLCAALAVQYGRLLKTERAGIVNSSLAVNGIFLGLALAAFCASTTILIAICLVSPALVGIFALISKRLLLPWNLPILVLPYILTMWVLWYVSAGTVNHWFRLPPSEVVSAISISGLTTSYFRGFSEIFFVESEALGIVVFMLLIAKFRKVGLEIALAAFYSLVVSWIVGFEGWVVMSGLTIFPAVFAVIACNESFDKLDKSSKFLMVACAPFMEMVALRIGLFTGLPAISLAYLLLVWGGVLILSYRSQMEKTMWRTSGLK
jgi:urea transporter